MNPDTPQADEATATEDASTKGTEKKPTRKASAKGTVITAIHVGGKRYEAGDAIPTLTKEEAEKLTRLGCVET